MNILFFDTETTGKADFKAPPGSENQPDMVQLAAILATDEERELCSFSMILAPIVKTITPEAAEIHGITQEYASQFGMHPDIGVDLFIDLLTVADVIVAHNLSFDLLVMRTAYSRLHDKEYLEVPTQFCTMLSSTELCKLPNKFGKSYKWPKLEEAYKIICGKTLVGAHDAMADVRACKDIFFELYKRED